MFVVITRIDALGMVNRESQDEILEWMRFEVKETKTKKNIRKIQIPDPLFISYL